MLGHNKQTDQRSKVMERSREVGQLVGDTLYIATSIFVCRSDVSFRRYAASSADVTEKLVQNLMFFVPQIWERAPEFLGTFVNQHHF